jgi:hypothetical protein
VRGQPGGEMMIGEAYAMLFTKRVADSGFSKGRLFLEKHAHSPNCSLEYPFFIRSSRTIEETP